MKELIADLDRYFCEHYANYDKLCVQPGYHMPEMHATKTDEYGRTVAYTLPPKTMRLSKQENKEQILAGLKAQMLDKTFSFSFQPYGFFKRIIKRFDKHAFHRQLKETFSVNKTDKAAACEMLTIDSEIWKRICRGDFLPTKNLIFSLALTFHFSFDQTQNLLLCCDYAFDLSLEKDVVIAYLLQKRVYNAEMVRCALEEYKVENLFIKEA